MNVINAGGGASGASPARETEAIEFVRFCYRRRRVGWPELYDEMCAVAGRGLYRGYGAEELAAIGIGFGLFEMPGLAVLVGQVVAEDVERRQRTAAALRSSLAVAAEAGLAPCADERGPVAEELPAIARRIEFGPADVGAQGHGSIRIAVGAGA